MLPYPRIPFSALRDLLGTVRALYRAELDAGSSPERLAKLAEIGQTLQAALKFSGEHPAVITYGHALSTAKTCIEQLQLLVGESPLSPLIEAVSRRFTKPKPSFH